MSEALLTNGIVLVLVGMGVGWFLRWLFCIPTIVKRLTQIAAAQGYVDAQKALHADWRGRVKPE